MTDPTHSVPAAIGPLILAALWAYAAWRHRRDMATRRRDYDHSRPEVWR